MLLHEITHLLIRCMDLKNVCAAGPEGNAEKIRGKQAIADMSAVWLVVEPAERRATYVADQRCAEATVFRLDKPSLFLQL